MKISEYFDKPYNESSHPIDRRMKIIKDNYIRGMSTENIRFIVNEICKRYCEELYVEVGSWKGCSLISAALFNDKAKFIGIDNFSEFNGDIKTIKKNIEKMNLSNVDIIEGDYRNIIPYTFKEKSIDVYYYDGEHTYDHQMNGLNIILPYMKEKCIIFVDDILCSDPLNATTHWLTNHTEFKSILLAFDKYNEKRNHHNPWWNGFMILSKGIEITI